MITGVIIFGHPGGWIAHFRNHHNSTVERGETGRTPQEIAFNVMKRISIKQPATLHREQSAIVITFHAGGEVWFDDLESLIATYLEFMGA